MNINYCGNRPDLWVPWKDLETLKTCWPTLRATLLILLWIPPCYTIRSTHTIHDIIHTGKEGSAAFPSPSNPQSKQVDICGFAAYLLSFIHHPEQVSIFFVKMLTLMAAVFPGLFLLVGGHRGLMCPLLYLSAWSGMWVLVRFLRLTSFTKLYYFVNENVSLFLGYTVST